MALDPDVKKFLEMMKSMPPFDPNMPVGKARELELSEMARMPREDVKSVAEHKIPGSSIWLREYVPSSSASNCALLYIHGGGYVFGSVETYDPEGLGYDKEYKHLAEFLRLLGNDKER